MNVTVSAVESSTGQKQIEKWLEDFFYGKLGHNFFIKRTSNN
jgi:hypothetical protein